jgi:hypothetical protein
MSEKYLEIRRRDASRLSVAADMVRHLHSRQELGAVLVVCDDPAEYRDLAHRQWSKLSRALQQRRANTLSAEAILKYTTAITRMQHMRFVADRPQDHPQANVYFVRPAAFGLLPVNCLTVYLLSSLASDDCSRLVAALPPAALVVDYAGQLQSGDHSLLSRVHLESQVTEAWSQVVQFLTECGICKEALEYSAEHTMGSLDDTLDSLLAVNAEFMEVAGRFLRVLNLARPLRKVPKATREQFEHFAQLAYRVQVLTPGASRSRLFNTDIDDTFALRDRRQLARALAALIRDYELSGHYNLARVLIGGA